MLSNQISAFKQSFQRNILHWTAIKLNWTNTNELSTNAILSFSAEFRTSSTRNELKHERPKNLCFEDWESRINVMKRYHFDDSICFRIISKYPDLIKVPLDRFESIILQWFHANLGLENVKLVLQSQPRLLDIDVDLLQKRLPYLRTYFPKSEQMGQLLMYSPNVLYDDWSEVLHKINYLFTVRQFKKQDVLQSNALSKTLGFIKFRFDILEKCGIYKQDYTPIHKVNYYDKSHHKNPTLKCILLSNIEDFVKIAKISIEEYQMYEDLSNAEENDENDD